MNDRVDVLIIGSGTAGLSALREVRRKTDSFLLINEGSWGTTCASVGCMPSKALIEAANAFHDRKRMDILGLTGADGLGVDIPTVMSRVRSLRDNFVKGPEKVAAELGDRAISGRARLLAPDRVVVEGRQIEAGRIILATGSSPIVPQAWQRYGERIVTTDSLFEQTSLPRRIAVIGMGAIGAEMAQALARLGLEVAGFDADQTMAGITDPQVGAVFQRLLSRELALHLGGSAELAQGPDGLEVASQSGRFQADMVLAALGRRPNVDDLGLETLGVALDKKGLPPVNPNTLQIADLPVFMAGDANAQSPILHEAADEGYIAGRNAVSDRPDGYCRRTRLAITFSSPGVASVGKRFVELDAGEIAVGEVDFTRQGRARMGMRDEGLMRLYGNRRSGKLEGAEMCVPAAEHLAHLLALAIEHAMTVKDMLAMPFYHPVLEEGMRSGLRALARQLPDRGGSDLSACPEIGVEALD